MLLFFDVFSRSLDHFELFDFLFLLCKPQSDVLLFFVVCVFQVKEEEKTCEVNPQSDVFAIIKLWHVL